MKFLQITRIKTWILDRLRKTRDWILINKIYSLLITILTVVFAGITAFSPLIFKKPNDPTPLISVSTTKMSAGIINKAKNCGNNISGNNINISCDDAIKKQINNKSEFDNSNKPDLLAKEAIERFCLQPRILTSLDKKDSNLVIGMCRDAIQKISLMKGVLQKEEVLIDLKAGDSKSAKAIYWEIAKRESEAGKESIARAVDAYRGIGALAFYDNTQEAIGAYQEVVKLDPKNTVAWASLSQLYIRTKQLEESEFASNKLLEIGKELNLNDNGAGVIIMGLSNLAEVDILRNDLPLADARIGNALEITKLLKCDSVTANIYIGKGNALFEQGKIIQAKESYDKAIEIIERSGDKMQKAKIYSALGTMYFSRGLGFRDLAEKYFKKSLDICETIGNKKACIARNYYYLGLINGWKGNKTQAEEFLQKSVLLYKEIHYTIYEEIVQNYLDKLTSREGSLPLN